MWLGCHSTHLQSIVRMIAWVTVHRHGLDYTPISFHSPSLCNSFSGSSPPSSSCSSLPSLPFSPLNVIPATKMCPTKHAFLFSFPLSDGWAPSYLSDLSQFEISLEKSSLIIQSKIGPQLFSITCNVYCVDDTQHTSHLFHEIGYALVCTRILKVPRPWDHAA